jgi:hypothetical protein
MRNKFLITTLLLGLLSTFTYGQSKGRYGAFHFARKLPNVENKAWYGITLPNDAFRNLNQNYSDVRILEIDGADTVETPYIVNILRDEETSARVEVKPFNKSILNGKQFTSFEVPPGEMANTVDLTFNENNFDLLVSIEGSDDGKTWFDVTKDQRIVSVFDNTTQFKDTDVSFPESRYKFLRMNINSTKLNLQSAIFRKNTRQEGKHLIVNSQFTVREDHESKMTLINIKSNEVQPVESIKIDVGGGHDYYRYYSLSLLVDSSKTEKGWIYSYAPVSAGYLTSHPHRPNTFDFDTQWAGTLQLTVFNNDNSPLKIEKITLIRPEVDVVSQLSPDKDYYLFYGNRGSGSSPSYDLVYFQDKIPDDLQRIQPEKEIALRNDVQSVVSPLIQNQAWLWIVMIAVIGLLGFFTLRMMKSK